MNRLLAIVSALLIVAGGVLWWQGRTQSAASVFDLPTAANAQESTATGSSSSDSSASGNAAADQSAPDLSLVKEEALGSADAPVTVIEYASFTCPHCEHWHATEWPKLKSDYVDTGKVRFILREVYFDRFGLWAGMLARCGGSTERYFAMVDMIYNQQQQWLASRTAPGIADALKKMGMESGLTDKQFETCMQDKKLAEALVAYYQKHATEDKIQGTPSFIIDGKLYSNMAWEDFKKIIDDELAKTKS